MKDYSSNITRALRKHYGITQKDFSEMIDVRQGTLSKIESGQLELSATQWISLCDHFKIDPSALLYGKIEMLIDDKYLSLDNATRVGSFKIPRKYSYNMGSTVRTAYPLIKFSQEKLGEEKTKELLKYLNVDPDYFVIQSHSVNLMFIHDFVNQLIIKGLIKAKNVADILKATQTSEVHSYVINQLSKSKKPQLAFKKFTQLLPRYYEINSNYDFIADKKCLIRVEDNEHIKEMNFNNEFLNFREDFNLAHFKGLSSFLDFDGELKTVRTNKGWDIAYSA